MKQTGFLCVLLCLLLAISGCAAPAATPSATPNDTAPVLTTPPAGLVTTAPGETTAPPTLQPASATPAISGSPAVSDSPVASDSPAVSASPAQNPSTVRPSSNATATATPARATLPPAMGTQAPTQKPATGTPGVLPTAPKTATPAATPQPTPTPAPVTAAPSLGKTVTPIPAATASPYPGNATASDTVAVINNRPLQLNQSVAQLKAVWGQPQLITNDPYGCQNYWYIGDYRNLTYAVIKNDKVVGFYTESATFAYSRLAYGQTRAQAASALELTNYKSDYMLYVTIPSLSVSIDLYFDTFEGDRLEGIYVLSSAISTMVPNYTDAVLEGMEMEMFHLFNARRVAHNLGLMTWDERMRTSARAHCLDMCTNNIWSHTGSDGSEPHQRMVNAGLLPTYHTAENLAAGSSTTTRANFALYNSASGHRDAMLTPKYTYLGVGVKYNASADLKIYYAQNFYMPNP